MSTSLPLQGQIALVTGASRGIGRACAIALAQAGAHVVAVARTQGALEDLDDEIRRLTGQSATLVPLDLAEGDSLDHLGLAIHNRFGRLDILVNNAGVLVWGHLEELTLDDLDRTLAVNIRSVFVACQEAAHHMGKGGRIINIGSTNADRIPMAGGSVYAMSKSALVGLTKGMARDLGPRGITVNNVQPGPVDTDMNPADGESAEQLKGMMALARYGKDDEIASFVAYLAGPEAGYVTGASLTIDGGFSA